jgi:type II secretory pathway pseudopilin PulG
MPERLRGGGGFTLIEMLAVMLLTAGVFIAAVTYYLALARASNAATDATRDERRGTAAVDRVARDLQEAALVRKPDALDPLAHPWLFLAEARAGGDGADRLKFATRSHVPRASALHESDLAIVTYFLAPAADGVAFELLRGSTPRLPPALDRSFPSPEDARIHRLVDGVASFSVRLLSEDGEWHDEWDSSTLVHSSDLPVAAEIRLALDPTEGDGRELATFVRRVVIPLRPLDLEVLLARTERDGEEERDEEDGECITVDECIARNPQIFQLLLSASPDLASVIDSIRGQCFRDHAATLAVQVEGCE